MPATLVAALGTERRAYIDGYGRERGAAGIRAFQELKHIVVGSR